MLLCVSGGRSTFQFKTLICLYSVVSELLDEDYAKRVYVSAWKRDSARKYVHQLYKMLSYTTAKHLFLITSI